MPICSYRAGLETASYDTRRIKAIAYQSLSKEPNNETKICYLSVECKDLGAVKMGRGRLKGWNKAIGAGPKTNADSLAALGKEGCLNIFNVIHFNSELLFLRFSKI
jgi:hypothetical protein